MNREELIAYDKWLTRRKWVTGEIISPEGAADIYLAEHSIPPAEGAEEILLRQRNGEDKPITYAVGKGGWVYKMILRAMTEFATLHAQRIAEKMVAENLVEFGNMIRDEPNGDIAALAEYFIRTINLKSRE